MSGSSFTSEDSNSTGWCMHDKEALFNNDIRRSSLDDSYTVTFTSKFTIPTKFISRCRGCGKCLGFFDEENHQQQSCENCIFQEISGTVVKSGAVAEWILAYKGQEALLRMKGTKAVGIELNPQEEGDSRNVKELQEKLAEQGREMREMKKTNEKLEAKLQDLEAKVNKREEWVPMSFVQTVMQPQQQLFQLDPIGNAIAPQHIVTDPLGQPTDFAVSPSLGQPPTNVYNPALMENVGANTPGTGSVGTGTFPLQ